MQLTSGGKTLGEVKINRVIFQGGSLSLTLFVITLISLSKLLRDTRAGYMLGEFRGKINNLFFMNDLQLCGKTM